MSLLLSFGRMVSSSSIPIFPEVRSRILVSVLLVSYWATGPPHPPQLRTWASTKIKVIILTKVAYRNLTHLQLTNFPPLARWDRNVDRGLVGVRTLWRLMGLYATSVIARTGGRPGDPFEMKSSSQATLLIRGSKGETDVGTSGCTKFRVFGWSSTVKCNGMYQTIRHVDHK